MKIRATARRPASGSGTGKRRRSRNKNKRSSGTRDQRGSLLYQNGYEAGFSTGAAEGTAAGQAGYETAWEGTSIIIPTYNKYGYLKECVNSIREYTPLPYEIIVVDNGSTDGTEAFLRSVAETGRVRYKRLGYNAGFAGAVNQGLMMARGSTVLLLNNDTVVTRNWLGNMLQCLHSDPRIGIVGPVTNFISGDQLVEKKYRNLNEMQRYAAQNNQSDSSRWETAERVTGFCMLFRRDLLDRVGYLDEGYQFGNYEDDDYCLRVGMSGMRLVIARDTFIHHYGNRSIRDFGPAYQEVNERNADFFSEKWPSRDALLTFARGNPELHAKAADFYPSHHMVHGWNGQQYWLQSGLKHPLIVQAGERWAGPSTLLSLRDLRSCVTGNPMTLNEVETAYAAVCGQQGEVAEGQLLRDAEGVCYQIILGARRRWTSDYTLRFWNFVHRPVREWGTWPEAARHAAEGLPLIAAPVLKAPNL
ncbi:hypothetical protein SY83_07205 [Paenibacillus swuensis]|uniref:Glycosyltransferase 2-like domain-containing protein n=1 Tax=Paenibacillus swuensis TaxID=1178515 RepID=A0A172TP12_9BACL|nr:hypothetical protein SY83_07205 [Paenibacillus swuensis]